MKVKVFGSEVCQLAVQTKIFFFTGSVGAPVCHPVVGGEDEGRPVVAAPVLLGQPHHLGHPAVHRRQVVLQLLGAGPDESTMRNIS